MQETQERGQIAGGKTVIMLKWVLQENVPKAGKTVAWGAY